MKRYIFDKLRENKKVRKYLAIYIHHKTLMGKGSAEVYTIRQVVQMVLLGKIAFTFLPMWSLYLIGLVMVFGFWTVGFLFDKSGGYDIEHAWSMLRDPMYKKLRHKLKLKDKELQNLWEKNKKGFE